MAGQELIDARARLGTALREARTGAGLTMRRVPGFSSGHVSQVENGRVQPSGAFVAAYVAMGGDAGRLFSLLDETRRAMRAPAESPASADIGDPRTDPRLLRRAYTVERIEDTYVIGDRREPVRNEHRVRVRPLVGGARYFPFRHAYEEDPRTGVSTVTPGGGCAMPLVEEGPSGTIYAVIDFAGVEPGPDGAHELAWTITMATDVPARTQVLGGAMAPIPLAATAVQFAEAMRPERVWWYRDFDTNAGTMPPSPDQLLDADETLTFRREFSALDREWWGISWTWPL